MNNCFYQFSQTCFWHEVHEHLAALPGVVITNAVDGPVISSWIDFTFRGHSFAINAESGEFQFFVDDSGCPASVLAEITAHFEPFQVEHGDGGCSGEINLRRV